MSDAKYVSEFAGLGDMTLLDVCAEIHADNTGASDPLSEERRAQLMSYLELRVDTWKEQTVKEWEAYDNVVRALCYVTLAEQSWRDR